MSVCSIGSRHRGPATSTLRDTEKVSDVAASRHAGAARCAARRRSRRTTAGASVWPEWLKDETGISNVIIRPDLSVARSATCTRWRSRAHPAINACFRNYQAVPIRPPRCIRVPAAEGSNDAHHGARGLVCADGCHDHRAGWRDRSSSYAIFYNGKIVTVDAGFNIRQAFAVRGDVYTAVGTNAAIRALAGRNTRLVNLQGASVIPVACPTTTTICTTPAGSCVVSIWSVRRPPKKSSGVSAPGCRGSSLATPYSAASDGAGR